MRYTGLMTRGEVKELLDRVLDWADDDQERFLRFVDEIERQHADDGISIEWGERDEKSGEQEVTKSN
jgi:hypothetical protein